MNTNQLTYIPDGKVCSKKIIIDTDGNKITQIEIVGGCHGNSQGISRLMEGMDIHDVIDRLEGVKCGGKQTSCPDQIAKALKTLL